MKRNLIQLAKICWIIVAIGLGSVLPTKADEQDINSSPIKRQDVLEWERSQQHLALQKLARSRVKRKNLSYAPEDENSLYADETASRLPLAKNDSEGVAVGDADGDGDLDIIIANEPIKDSEGNPIPCSGQNKLLINDSTGKFVDETTTRLPVDDFRTSDVEFGDIDSDGDLDIYVTNWLGEADRLLVNNGTGVFNEETSAKLPNEALDRSYGTDAEIGDLDGDGDLDIVVANDLLGPNRLLINNGLGNFSDETDSQLQNDIERSQDLDIGDIDNDGDLDIVVANGFATEEQNRLFINNSKGVFEEETSLRLPTRLDDSEGVTFVDANGDKALGIFFANSIEESRLYINDGTGKFSDDTANRLPVGTDFRSGEKTTSRA